VLTAAMLLAAAPARAATVGFYYWSGTVYYAAAPGEANNVTVSTGTNSYLISDPAATITAQYGCTLTDAHHATCSSAYVKGLYISTNDLDDSISLQSQTPAWVNCGTGTDSLNTPSTSVSPSGCELVNVPPASAPPPPAAAPTPVLPPLSIGQPVATMTPKGSVPLTLTCSDSATDRCVGTLILELPKKATKSGVTTSRRGAPNILGKEKLSIAKGKKRKVKVAMTGKGRGMVKRRKKLRVTARLKIKQGGETTTTTQSLTINAPRHRR
jgi:hypothetical protein